MEDVLTYPLTAIPLGLYHIDGKMNKATKNTFLHSVPNLPETCGFVSRSILKEIYISRSYFLKDSPYRNQSTDKHCK